jgi:hypothetical protein
MSSSKTSPPQVECLCEGKRSMAVTKRHAFHDGEELRCYFLRT